MAEDLPMGYATPADMLADFQDHNQVLGRTSCPACDYIEAHLDGPIDDVKAYLYSSPDIAPGLICDGLLATANYQQWPKATLEDAIADQESMTALLAPFPYEVVRNQLEPLLKRWDMALLSRTAVDNVLAYIQAGHPNPKAFLMKPEVLAKIPADVDLTDYPCPDFPELADVPVFGTAE